MTAVPERAESTVAPGWWDYTTLPPDLLDRAARLTADDVAGLSRPGFAVRMFDDLQSFYLAEALEYVQAWRQSTPERPAGICGPVGPTEQLPLVAELVNALDIPLRHCHFWGMDEWVVGSAAVGRDHPLSFARANAELCFDRIRPELAMPAENIHFPGTDNAEFDASWKRARCVVMQGGQGEVKHWAFNEPPRRAGAHVAAPPSAAEYRALSTRVVELHPMTLMQNARTSGGGRVDAVPQRAATVGPVQTWQAERVSLWHAGTHDNPFGMRLTALMVSERIVDTAVPVSLLGEHPDVTFSYLRSGLGTVQAEMH